MDFKKALIKNKARDTEYKTVKVKYDNEFYCIINDTRYSIITNPNKITVLYSLPSNSKYEAWTKRKITKLPNKDIALKYWSILKPNLSIKGKIVENTFHIKS